MMIMTKVTYDGEDCGGGYVANGTALVTSKQSFGFGIVSDVRSNSCF